ncbi:MAG: hypothetical protein IKE66_05060 [Hyphomicrobium sp.]|nr:hypothetical protein [Hyphomicrobium sp.]
MNRKMIIAAIGVLALAFTGAATFLAWRAGIIKFGHSPTATSTVSGPEQDDQSPPRDGMTSVRKLFRYQDQVAKGDVTAIRSQNEMIDTIADEFRTFKRKDWAEPRNVQAMMAYVLSGGKTEVVEKFLSLQLASQEQEQLAKGVLSFALRRPKTAIKQIGDLETRALERPLVSVVSLALASLHASENSERSIALFDDARLHAPSTAVEESALRREVPLLLKAQEIERADALIARYIRVFGQSPFSSRFYADLATAFAALEETKAATAMSAIDGALSDEPEGSKTGFFLGVSRAALIAGKIQLAKTAADIVAKGSPEGTASTEKARLYAAAAVAATESADSVLPELEDVEDASLDDEEKSLRAAAEMIARSVVEAGSVKAGTASRGDMSAGPVTAVSSAGISAVVQKADNALKEADRLISSVKE